MSILGVQTIVYGVDDLEASARFYSDFGLQPLGRHERGADFGLPEGSRVLLRLSDDPSLPPTFATGPGAREIIWGVDSTASLEALAKNLSADREATRDADGTLHVRDDIGIPIGFRLWERAPLAADDSPENGLGTIRRWNAHRKWYERAAPKLIHHVVFSTPDIDTATAFYTKRLGFRITDVSRGLGLFMRCDGRNDHHNLFLLKSPRLAWNHASFGVENIDELMTGANHMQRCGWTSDVGIGRHRISSTVFYYMPNPAGGRSEYSADTDYLTDEWRPRLWEPMFGNWHWVGKVPDAFRNAPAWDVRVLEEPIPPFSALG
jgi:catechol 2,3-dioxygenase-like lactoylglutathione lyase family enzyme